MSEAVHWRSLKAWLLATDWPLVNKVCPDFYRIHGRGCGSNREEEKEDKEEKNAVLGFRCWWENITRENGTIMMPTGNPGLMVKTQHSLAASGGGHTGRSINYPFTWCILWCAGMSAAKKRRMCLCVKNQTVAAKVCQPITQGLAVTRKLQASAGQVATEALSVITNKSWCWAPPWRRSDALVCGRWCSANKKHHFLNSALCVGSFCGVQRHI